MLISDWSSDVCSSDLQYLRAPAQRQLLEDVIAMLTPGARLVIRTGLVDGSRRGLVSRIGDRAANLIGWMQSSPRCYPDADVLRALLEGAGLQVTIEPLWGRPPLNNWLGGERHAAERPLADRKSGV